MIYLTYLIKQHFLQCSSYRRKSVSSVFKTAAKNPPDCVSDRKGLHRGIYVLKHIIHTRMHGMTSSDFNVTIKY